MSDGAVNELLLMLAGLAVGTPVFLFFWCRSINRSDAEFSQRQRAREERRERNSTAFWKM